MGNTFSLAAGFFPPFSCVEPPGFGIESGDQDWAEVDGPDIKIDWFEPKGLTTKGVADEKLPIGPPNHAAGVDLPGLEVPGIVDGREF